MYLLLFSLWLIFNGRLTAEVCLLGLAVTAALAGLMYVLFGYTPAREVRIMKKVPTFIAYVFVLIWEIIKANAAMYLFIINEKRTIAPVLVTFTPELKTEFGRFLLANSITLTPGTITVDVTGGSFTVHCLKREMLDTSEENVFLRWIRRLEA